MKLQITQRRIATLLTLLLCFFAIAVYTPLHVHENGDPKKCSLNNIEHQVADGVAPVLALPQPSADTVRVEPAPEPPLPAASILTAASRGPPSASLA